MCCVNSDEVQGEHGFLPAPEPVQVQFRQFQELTLLARSHTRPQTARRRPAGSSRNAGPVAATGRMPAGRGGDKGAGSRHTRRPWQERHRASDGIHHIIGLSVHFPSSRGLLPASKLPEGTGLSLEPRNCHADRHLLAGLRPVVPVSGDAWDYLTVTGAGSTRRASLRCWSPVATRKRVNSWGAAGSIIVGP